MPAAEAVVSFDQDSSRTEGVHPIEGEHSPLMSELLRAAAPNFFSPHIEARRENDSAG